MIFCSYFTLPDGKYTMKPMEKHVAVPNLRYGAKLREFLKS